MKPFAVVPTQIEALPLPFTPAIRSGDLLFISGQASVDERGKIISDSFEGEMRRSMDNLGRILEAASCRLGDVVRVRAYVERAEDLARYNVLYREYFAEPLPARTTLINCLGNLKFEIDAVARVPRDADVAPA